MQSARSVCKIVDHQVGPIFAEAIGKDALVRRTPTQIDDRVSSGLNAPYRLHRSRFARCVPDPDLNGAVWIFRVELHYVDKIGSSGQPAAGDRQLLAGAKCVAER